MHTSLPSGSRRVTHWVPHSSYSPTWVAPKVEHAPDDGVAVGH